MDRPQIHVSEDLQAAYHAALESCLVVEHEPPGLVVARGASTLDLLHRMSTNNMTDLEPGHIRTTVLTTAIGRTVDVIHVIRRAEDFLILTSPGRAESVRAWLGRYIFFNDDVVLSEMSNGYHLWGMYGPSATDEAVAAAGVATAPDSPSCTIIGESLLWRTEKTFPGLCLLAAGDLHRRAQARWNDRGPGSPQAAAYEAHRIERGLPAPDREIDEDVIPLEVGLWHLVSFDKGCYIGQEIIARMESRSRIARQLTGVRLETLVSAPQDIEQADAPVGRLTSTAFSPRLGPIGLGLVRSALLQHSPTEVRLAPSGVRATLLPLPLDPLAS